MTEYGRGSGSQPWHPEDPLYGDPGYGGQRYAPQQQPQQSQPSYGGQQPQGGQPYGWDQQGQAAPYAGDGTAHQDPYAAQHHTGQHHVGQHDTGQHHVGQHDTGQHHVGQHDTGQHHVGQHSTGQHSTGTYAVPQAGDPSDPYGTGQYAAPQQRQGEHEQLGAREWHQEEPDAGKLALFDDRPDDRAVPGDPAGDEPAAAEEGGRGRERRGKGKTKKNKRRSGTACLLVAVVLVGAVGGGGYLAYDYWQTHFGAAPDYEGEGTGQVQVEIPKGASLTEMGQVLFKAGVVKSVGAFTEAAAKKSIQPGTYTLRKEMSGQAAVALMTDAKNFLTLREGIRASEVYSAIDKKLGLTEGTTKGVAKSQAKNLGLPDWAGSDPNVKDPLEGFLFPSQYSAGKGTKPEDILRQMVARAKQNYEQQDVAGKAQALGLKSPLQVVTVASLVQVEGKYKHDFDKISRVVYNRLKPDNKETYGLLDFDSTVNYARNQSTLDTGAVRDLRQFNDPYNTYKIKGLPPGPISNPGTEALKSALQPADGPWYYFVSINENETLFAVTNAEHNRNRQRYEQENKKKAGSS
ncbi:membrane protein [Streptomyces mashuensis]|uniref:Endolytic murein transglycosylase n=1 Tax=Streptomyces mashuensis TaxID=33904 RepID=A0A919EC96_9ACTN|nr:endolytic transglycosylase MltG [Streptomyces mashuensis]GHF39210.1 membrane protein [Streptomyces mashuensis]